MVNIEIIKKKIKPIIFYGAHIDKRVYILNISTKHNIIINLFQLKLVDVFKNVYRYMPMPNLYVSTTHGRHKTKEIFLAVNELRLHKLHTHSSHQNVVFFYSHIQTKKKFRIIRNTRVQHRAHGI